MNHQMHIDFDDGRFLIRCPKWANDIVRMLPDRRFSKSKQGWTAPLLRQNAEKMGEIMKMGGVTTTPRARAALDDYLKRAAATRASGERFPSWYRFKRTPRKWQMEALNKKWAKKTFALHADRRTGKCSVAINYGCAKRMAGEIDNMLVCVKLSGRRTWVEEFEKDAPIPYDIYLPTTDNVRGFEKWLHHKSDFKIMVVGLESLSEGRMIDLVKKFVNCMGKIYMVVDEAHMIANTGNVRHDRCVEVGKQTTLRDTMTGTPISTGPLNLFGQFEFLDPDIIGIGDFYAFRNRYAMIIEKKTKAGQKYPLIVGYQNMPELTGLVAPYTYECRKEDVLDMPKIDYQKAHVELTTEQRKLYDQIRREKSYVVAGKELVVQNVLELALRLHTVAGGFAATYEEQPYLGRDKEIKLRKIATWHPIVPWKKNPKIIELIDLAADQVQFIIWAAYIAEIRAIVEALHHAFPKERVVEIHGGISEDDRAKFRHIYQDGGAKFMVGNTATGGSADSWSACDTMIYYNNTERMIDREQSRDRPILDVSGYKNPNKQILYIDLIAEKTVDVTIMKSIEQKVDLAEYIRRNIKDAGALLEGA